MIVTITRSQDYRQARAAVEEHGIRLEAMDGRLHETRLRAPFTTARMQLKHGVASWAEEGTDPVD